MNDNINSNININHMLGVSVETYLRIKPFVVPNQSVNVVSTKKFSDNNDLLNIKLQTVKVSEDVSKDVIELDIPEDADPGIIHSNYYNDDNSNTIRYEFDQIFDENTTQDEIFRDIVENKIYNAIVNGINSTIFCYGQTGSGKTYSMCGGENNYNDRGIIPRTIGYIFTYFNNKLKLSNDKDKETVSLSSDITSLTNNNYNNSYRITITFLEIYKEIIYDLLPTAIIDQSNALKKPNLPIVQILESNDENTPNKTGGQITMRNVNVYEVNSEEEALSLFFYGITNRNTSITSMNNLSSRSHAIFTIIIENEGLVDNLTTFTKGKINLVDLAGSERMYKLNNSKRQIIEAKSINLSLHFLEQVIINLRNNLTNKPTNNSPNHIPYRNSVLTTLLRDSLGGNCRSCFLFTISKEAKHFEETVSTCRFAHRCSEIKLTIKPNSEISSADQIKILHNQIKILSNEIKHLNDLNNQLTNQLNDFTINSSNNLRLLTEEEKSLCKQSVHDLLVKAKESMNSNDDTQPKELLEESLNNLYNITKSFDKSILLELTNALGSLLQNLYIDKEKLKYNEIQLLNQIHKLVDNSNSNNDTITTDLNDPLLRTIPLTTSLGNRLGIDLPDDIIEVVIKGAVFLKHCRMNRLKVRYIFLTPDLLNICWRQIGNLQTQKSMTLKSFDRVEINPPSKQAKEKESSLIMLSSKSKKLLFEYAICETIEENRTEALKWTDALAKCIDRSKK